MRWVAIAVENDDVHIKKDETEEKNTRINFIRNDDDHLLSA